ncbi:hypothetical protein P0D91_27840 [Pseudomonas sp. CBSPBW29]|uniref:hypothetical protein n=1 Tax=Pseudomonas yamanorum TaxID=515393 RepID=UPI0023D9B7C8|nr:hypothetical protein P0D91_27840 [Pseudomonas sp. CBSPBW29]WEL62949.1 hypothetical protein P0D93_22025 [Pseudomonas sp. CBSPGW29]WEL72134.1 hypothetical protein P0D94_07960 [Pseudomonas sp. CBSPCGW29]WEL79031.1 hypothetical protein P0D92_13955 [Pseudomonas sp. CBSPAW29]
MGFQSSVIRIGYRLPERHYSTTQFAFLDKGVDAFYQAVQSIFFSLSAVLAESAEALAASFTPTLAITATTPAAAAIRTGATILIFLYLVLYINWLMQVLCGDRGGLVPVPTLKNIMFGLLRESNKQAPVRKDRQRYIYPQAIY